MRSATTFYGYSGGPITLVGVGVSVGLGEVAVGVAQAGLESPWGID